MWYVYMSRGCELQADYYSQATGYQKKYTKRKILFLLFLLVIGMFILLLVKPKRTKSPPPPPSADPIGTMEEAKIQPEIAESKPDIIQPHGGKRGSDGRPP